MSHKRDLTGFNAPCSLAGPSRGPNRYSSIHSHHWNCLGWCQIRCWNRGLKGQSFSGHSTHWNSPSSCLRPCRNRGWTRQSSSRHSHHPSFRRSCLRQCLNWSKPPMHRMSKPRVTSPLRRQVRTLRPARTKRRLKRSVYETCSCPSPSSQRHRVAVLIGDWLKQLAAAVPLVTGHPVLEFFDESSDRRAAKYEKDDRGKNQQVFTATGMFEK